MNIIKALSRQQIDAVFDGEAPHYHPDEFWNTRLFEKRIFIATIDEKPVGLLSYTIWWGNCPFLELIHIQDNHQRKGIGSLLLEEAAKEIKGKKLKTLISSSEIINDIGNEFHQDKGFKKLNSLTLPHGEEQFYSIDIEKLT